MGGPIGKSNSTYSEFGLRLTGMRRRLKASALPGLKWAPEGAVKSAIVPPIVPRQKTARGVGVQCGDEYSGDCTSRYVLDGELCLPVSKRRLVRFKTWRLRKTEATEQRSAH